MTSVETHYVDCSKLVDKPVSTFKLLFQYWFDLCAFHQPAILVLDNLDVLLPAEQEVISDASEMLQNADK
jgi:peroxin-1